jgi:Eco29kI restriction endonuclease
MALKTYNPLEKLNLAQSIKAAILANDVLPLGRETKISGAGVYVLYYKGTFHPYADISSANDKHFNHPIYVGKAIPKGGRKGGLSDIDPLLSNVLSNRLRKHAESIDAASNLDLADFYFRAIVLDDIWIPLGENILIETFQPLWNVVVEGFGINDPGKGRLGQKRSAWDALHPGRTYAERLKGGGPEANSIIGRIDDYFKGKPLRPIPKSISSPEE